MKAWRRRDLTIVSDLGQNKSIVVACDSCGGIGHKNGDVLKISPYYVGKLTVRVGLTEVICSGCKPFVVANSVACEMEPTGKEIILGIRDELKNAMLENVVLTGSTEENFNTIMTATGITVMGIGDNDTLRFNKAAPNDKVILLGKPLVGDEVDLSFNGFYNEIEYLLSQPTVREIIPVGSKGIAFESNLIADLNGLNFAPFKSDINLYKAAGPATCILAVCDDEAAAAAIERYPSSFMVGELRN